MAEPFEPMLTAAERAFLVRVRDGEPPAEPTKVQLAVRSRCIRLGYASLLEEAGTWLLTAKGNAAIDRYETEKGLV